MDSADGHTDTPDSHAAAREVMARVAQRDPLAFQELYDSHADIVYSVAMQLLRDEAEAGDLLQEVFLKIWNASELYDPVLGKVVSWIITITRRRCLNRLRSGQRRAAAHRASAEENAASPESGEDSCAALLRAETALAVNAALDSLPPEQSEAIRLSFLNGLTHEETAERLRAPLGTVKARIRRGLARMKEQLQFIR
jgi:RNA polymerase sigma-70 factor (ECF subfamily)